MAEKPSCKRRGPKGAFTCFTAAAAEWTGSPFAFLLAALLIIGWASSGWFFQFSETWQLVINTTTTIVTFLMVFLIQSTQNRDTHALQLKLDELIRATHGAHNALLDIEELSEGELLALRDKYEELAESARETLTKGGSDSDSPEIDLSQPKS
ncbi:MAG: low affinity iron permease family protein [Alphaproteobacteria bacterium]